jgi:RNA polymerase sigma factor (TIGR02999 family)
MPAPSPDLPPGEVTRLLAAAQAGAPGAASRLLEAVYAELRALAQARMNQERREHTLQATALVHEAYIRLIGRDDLAVHGRASFFHAAAEAMRRILIDHARKRNAVRRGGGLRPIGDVMDLAAEENLGDALALDELILRLEKEDAQAASVVRLRFYAGLGVEQVAEVLDISPRTVKRDWAYARAWLLKEWEASVPAGDESGR